MYTFLIAVMVVVTSVLFLWYRTRILDKNPQPKPVITQPEPPQERVTTTTTVTREKVVEPLLSLTKEELLAFNGENGRPIYVSFLVSTVCFVLIF